VAAFAVALTAMPARSGERLTVEEIAQRAHGAAVVRVALKPSAVHVVRVIGGLPADTQATTTWLGLCLPSQKSLRRWTIEHAKWPARELWRRALSRGEYQAIVMVEKYEGGYRPRCGVEAMEMEHTDISKGYTEYVRKVEDALGGRASGPRP
jgi:hypothetical protein